MRILFLSEGNPETRDSWSGTSKSIVDALRAAGHAVLPGDVELSGWDRWTAAAATLSTARTRWRWRFRLGYVPFILRSRRASALVRGGEVDAVLQIGATFRPTFGRRIPWFLYCDSNIAMSRAGRTSGRSEASVLADAELAGIAAREASIYHAADGIFAMSERLRQSFIGDFAVAESRVHTVHCGPNFDPRTLDAYRPSRGQGQPPTVLFVGRDFERKGGDILLKAFSLVRSRIPAAQLHIVGPRHPMGDHPGVTWLGFLDPDVPADRQRLTQAYANADVFCLPTRFEPFGIVFLEAMYAGLPCVGTDVWAVPEMIVHGETGWLVRPDDADALAERLFLTLNDPQLAHRLGAAGAARARSYFTWPAVVTRMLAVLSPAVPARVH